jgi:hypothetical protein
MDKLLESCKLARNEGIEGKWGIFKGLIKDKFLT